MTMQDRAYAAAIFIILGICCIGAYVAVSGLMNANPEGLTAAFSAPTLTPTVGVTIEIPTETPAPPSETPPPSATPSRTPRGFVPSPTPAFTRPPTLDYLPTIPTGAPETATPEASPTPEGCGAIYCPQLGPADPRAPTGNPCPSNYIWGFVLNENGQGESGMRIAIREESGGGDRVTTKGPPDPPGRFDFPAGGGTWTVQLLDRQGDPLSSPFQVVAGASWGGSGNCPTRVDFVKQR